MVSLATETATRPARPRGTMHTVLTLAGKELREGLRNRWVLATTLLLAALALTLALLGSAPTGTVGASRLDVVTVSLASLTIFLVPLIALLLSHDAIAGEAERGTLLLLLAYPVGRGAVILGKFLGQLAILAFATLCGYGAAALARRLEPRRRAAGPPSPRCSAPRSCSAASSSPSAFSPAPSSASAPPPAASPSASGCCSSSSTTWRFLGLLVADRRPQPAAAPGRHAARPQPDRRLSPAHPRRRRRRRPHRHRRRSPATPRLTPPVLVVVLLAWTAVPLALAALVFARREL